MSPWPSPGLHSLRPPVGRAPGPHDPGGQPLLCGGNRHTFPSSRRPPHPPTAWDSAPPLGLALSSSPPALSFLSDLKTLARWRDRPSRLSGCGPPSLPFLLVPTSPGPRWSQPQARGLGRGGFMRLQGGSCWTTASAAPSRASWLEVQCCGRLRTQVSSCSEPGRGDEGLPELSCDPQ